MKKFIIIGGGPAGYVAAIRAATLGAEVILIEEDRLGGTCLNRGCIPTKAMYASANLIHEIQKGDTLGIDVDNYKVDMKKVQEHKNKTIDSLVSGIEKLMKAKKVEVIKGTASFLSDHEIEVLTDSETIKLYADYIIISTGSKNFNAPIKGIDNEKVLDSTKILNLETIPKSIAVIGGGVIGMEFANIFKAFGSEVTVIEKFSVLNTIDSEIAKRFAAKVKKNIKLHDKTEVMEIVDNGETLTVKCENKKGSFEVEAEYVLSSIGRIGNLDNLKLENTSIEHNNRFVNVDNNYKTNVENIYAVGDVNGKSLLAHAASYQAVSLVENLIQGSSISNPPVPSCIFTFPEVASVGMSEEEVKEKGIEYKKAKFMFAANGKALTMVEGDGFIKCIAEKDTNKLLGVHIMGPHASDLIAEAGVAVSKGYTVDDIKNVIHSHPTLAETFYEAVLMLNGEAIHSM